MERFGGWNLQNGDFRPTRYIRGAPSLGVIKGTDAGFVSARSNISSDTLVWFLNYGLTSNLDLSVAVPWDASVVGCRHRGVRCLRRRPRAGSYFSSPIQCLQCHRSWRYGDRLAKYHFWHHHEGGFAGQLEVRLPTGDTDELRGLGVVRTQASLYLVAGRHGIATRQHRIRRLVPTRSQSRPREASSRRTSGGMPPASSSHPMHVSLSWPTCGDGSCSEAARSATRRSSCPKQSRSETLAGLRHGVSAVSLAPGLKWNPAGERSRDGKSPGIADQPGVAGAADSRSGLRLGLLIRRRHEAVTCGCTAECRSASPPPCGRDTHRTDKRQGLRGASKAPARPSPARRPRCPTSPRTRRRCRASLERRLGARRPCAPTRSSASRCCAASSGGIGRCFIS